METLQKEGEKRTAATANKTILNKKIRQNQADSQRAALTDNGPSWHKQRIHSKDNYLGAQSTTELEMQKN